MISIKGLKFVDFYKKINSSTKYGFGVQFLTKMNIIIIESYPFSKRKPVGYKQKKNEHSIQIIKKNQEQNETNNRLMRMEKMVKTNYITKC